MGASDSFRRLEEELTSVCLMKTWEAGGLCLSDEDLAGEGKGRLGSRAHARSQLRQFSLGSSGVSSKATDLSEARMSQQSLGLLRR